MPAVALPPVEPPKGAASAKGNPPPVAGPAFPKDGELEMATRDSAKNALANPQDPDDAAPLAKGKIKQQTYTMVRRVGADGNYHTYCVWIALTDDNGKFLRYGNVNSQGFNTSVTKLLEVTSQKKYADRCEKIFAKGAGQISFNITSKPRDPNETDSEDNEITKITLKNSTCDTSLTLSNEDETGENVDPKEKQSEKEAVSNFMQELLAIQKDNFIINQGKPEADPRGMFGGETNDKDSPKGVDGKPIPMKTLDKDKVDNDTQLLNLKKMVSRKKVPKIDLYQTRLSLSTLNSAATTAKLKEHQGSPMFMPVEFPDGKSVYLCLDKTDKAKKALYYYDPTDDVYAIRSQEDTNKMPRTNSICEGKPGALNKALHQFCKTHGVKNLYAPTELHTDGYPAHYNGLQWFKYLSDLPTLSPDTAFPTTKMDDIKIPRTPEEIQRAAKAEARKKTSKSDETDDELVETDDEIDPNDEITGDAPKKADEPAKPTLAALIEPAIQGIVVSTGTQDSTVQQKIAQWTTGIHEWCAAKKTDERKAVIARWAANNFIAEDTDLMTKQEPLFHDGTPSVNAENLQKRKQWLNYLATQHNEMLLAESVAVAPNPDVPKNPAASSPPPPTAGSNDVSSSFTYQTPNDFFGTAF